MPTPTSASVVAPVSSALTRGKACKMCRQRKRRCDAGKPICAACIKVGLSFHCEYDDEHAARPKKQSHLKILEGKIGELEGHIQLLETTKRAAVEEPAPIGLPSTFQTPRPRPTLPLDGVGGRHPSIPPLIQDPHEDAWVQQGTVPPNIRDDLISVFVRYRWQFAFEFNVPRFINSLKLPPSHPNAPHPALLNAIFLNGCFYSQTRLRRYESVFYRRTFKELARSLANVDRLFDFLRASALAACYFFGAGRVVEGYTCLSAALRFAIGCGFHTLSSLSLDTGSPLMPPCTDLVELGDRINTFWTLFCLDRVGSLVSGLPYTIGDEKITTIWPCPWDCYKDGAKMSQPAGSIMSMYDPSLLLPPCQSENYQTLRAKSVALLHRASILSAQARTADSVGEPLRREILSTCKATSVFAGTLPPFCVQADHIEDPDAVRSILAIAFTAAHAAVIQIYGIFAQDNPAAHDRQLKSARAAMVVVKEMRAAQFSYIPIFLGWSLTPVHEFLVKEKLRHDALGDKEGARSLQTDIDILLHTLKRVGELFPVAATVQASILEKNVLSLESA
ncbi:hypothetical protein BOTBODRAFT_179386 [Botryobasidium botryosum FD-172 SS1]|uniref:Zn(2)-C6 fungal-type domain-containing protein n=1 Tax=Botryobasidium botryosum (strain FD-172 SS1) TaxID=930990 RepID=A0A067M2W3_BOTB1|nr:hypothetical protein BOTBODRAFT_179386 [Botryobasidium botryosum FD-172 SS1]